jgi:hypothetical protein
LFEFTHILNNHCLSIETHIDQEAENYLKWNTKIFFLTNKGGVVLQFIKINFYVNVKACLQKMKLKNSSNMLKLHKIIIGILQRKLWLLSYQIKRLWLLYRYKFLFNVLIIISLAYHHIILDACKLGLKHTSFHEDIHLGWNYWSITVWYALLWKISMFT